MLNARQTRCYFINAIHIVPGGTWRNSLDCLGTKLSSIFAADSKSDEFIAKTLTRISLGYRIRVRSAGQGTGANVLENVEMLPNTLAW